MLRRIRDAGQVSLQVAYKGRLMAFYSSKRLNNATCVGGDFFQLSFDEPVGTCLVLYNGFAIADQHRREVGSTGVS